MVLDGHDQRVDAEPCLQVVQSHNGDSTTPIYRNRRVARPALVASVPVVLSCGASPWLRPARPAAPGSVSSHHQRWAARRNGRPSALLPIVLTDRAHSDGDEQRVILAGRRGVVPRLNAESFSLLEFCSSADIRFTKHTSPAYRTLEWGSGARSHKIKPAVPTSGRKIHTELIPVPACVIVYELQNGYAIISVISLRAPVAA